MSVSYIFCIFAIKKLMAKPVLQIKGHTADSIKALIRKDERYTIGLRLYAVYQVAKGQSSRKLEDLYNWCYANKGLWASWIGLRERNCRSADCSASI